MATAFTIDGDDAAETLKRVGQSDQTSDERTEETRIAAKHLADLANRVETNVKNKSTAKNIEQYSSALREGLLKLEQDLADACANPTTFDRIPFVKQWLDLPAAVAANPACEGLGYSTNQMRMALLKARRILRVFCSKPQDAMSAEREAWIARFSSKVSEELRDDATEEFVDRLGVGPAQEWVQAFFNAKVDTSDAAVLVLAAFLYTVDLRICDCETLEACEELQSEERAKEAAGQEVKKHRGKVARPKHTDAHGWRGEPWAVVNWTLRVGGDSTQPEAVVERCRTTLQTFAFLREKWDEVLCILPSTRSVVFRGLTVQVSSKFQLDTPVVFPAFTSTSLVGTEAQAFMNRGASGTFFIIRVHTASMVQQFSWFPEQAEALLKSFSTFAVKFKMSRTVLQMLGCRYDVITMIELGDEDATPDQLCQSLLHVSQHTAFIYESHLARYVVSRVDTMPPPRPSNSGEKIFGPIDDLVENSAGKGFITEDWLVNSDRHMLLLGSAGTGKTSTALAALSRLTTVKRARGAKKIFTIFTPLPSVRHLFTEDGALDNHVRRQLGLRNEADMEHLTSTFTCVLLLDSLDEVNTTDVPAASIRAFIDRNPLCSQMRCIISCRPEFMVNSNIDPPSAAISVNTCLTYYVLPFERNDVNELIERVVHTEHTIPVDQRDAWVPRVAEAVEAMQLDHETSHTPVTLNMAILVAIRRLVAADKSPDSEEGLSQSGQPALGHSESQSVMPQSQKLLKFELYDAYLNSFTHGMKPEDSKQLRLGLWHIALRMINVDRWNISVGEAVKGMSDAGISAAKARQFLENHTPCRMEDAHQDRSAFEWQHKSIGEFLAAQALWMQPDLLDTVTKSFSLSAPAVCTLFGSIARAEYFFRLQELIDSSYLPRVFHAHAPVHDEQSDIISSNALALLVSANVVLSHIRLQKLVFLKVNFTNARLDSIDFTRSSFHECMFDATSFKNCILDGTDFNNCQFNTERSLAKHGAGINTITINPENLTILTGSRDRSSQVVSLLSGKPQALLPHLSAVSAAVSWGSDERLERALPSVLNLTPLSHDQENRNRGLPNDGLLWMDADEAKAEEKRIKEVTALMQGWRKEKRPDDLLNLEDIKLIEEEELTKEIDDKRSNSHSNNWSRGRVRPNDGVSQASKTKPDWETARYDKHSGWVLSNVIQRLQDVNIPQWQLQTVVTGSENGTLRAFRFVGTILPTTGQIMSTVRHTLSSWFLLCEARKETINRYKDVAQKVWDKILEDYKTLETWGRGDVVLPAKVEDVDRKMYDTIFSCGSSIFVRDRVQESSDRWACTEVGKTNLGRFNDMMLKVFSDEKLDTKYHARWKNSAMNEAYNYARTFASDNNIKVDNAIARRGSFVGKTMGPFERVSLTDTFFVPVAVAHMGEPTKGDSKPNRILGVARGGTTGFICVCTANPKYPGVLIFSEDDIPKGVPTEPKFRNNTPTGEAATELTRSDISADPPVYRRWIKDSSLTVMQNDIKHLTEEIGKEWKPRQTLDHKGAAVSTLAVRGTMLVSAAVSTSNDEAASIWVWNLEDLSAPIKVLGGCEGKRIDCVTINADLIAVADVTTVRLWSYTLADRKFEATRDIKLRTTVHTLTLTEFSELLVGGDDEQTGVWNLITREEVKKSKGSQSAVAIVPSGTRALTATNENEVEDMKLAGHQASGSHSKPIRAACEFGDGGFATAALDNTIRLWDSSCASIGVLAQPATESGVTAIANVEGQIISGSTRGALYACNPLTSDVIRIAEDDYGGKEVTSITAMDPELGFFATTGTWIIAINRGLQVTAKQDVGVKIHAAVVPNFKERSAFFTAGGNIGFINLAGDGSLSVCNEKILEIHDKSSIHSLLCIASQASDPSTLVCGSSEGTARVVKISGSPGNPLLTVTHTFNPTPHFIQAVAVASNGLIYVGSSSGDVSAWSLEGKEDLVVRTGTDSTHTAAISALSCIDGGNRVVAVSQDLQSSVWQMPATVKYFIGHHGTIQCLGVTKDGRRIISRDDQNVTIVWDTDGTVIDRFVGNFTEIEIGKVIAKYGSELGRMYYVNKVLRPFHRHIRIEEKIQVESGNKWQGIDLVRANASSFYIAKVCKPVAIIGTVAFSTVGVKGTIGKIDELLRQTFSHEGMKRIPFTSDAYAVRSLLPSHDFITDNYTTREEKRLRLIAGRGDMWFPTFRSSRVYVRHEDEIHTDTEVIALYENKALQGRVIKLSGKTSAEVRLLKGGTITLPQNHLVVLRAATTTAADGQLICITTRSYAFVPMSFFQLDGGKSGFVVLPAIRKNTLTEEPYPELLQCVLEDGDYGAIDVANTKLPDLLQLLNVAICRKKIEVVRSILDQMPTIVFEQDLQGRLPMHHARRWNRTESIALINDTLHALTKEHWWMVRGARRCLDKSSVSCRDVTVKPVNNVWFFPLPSTEKQLSEDEIVAEAKRLQQTTDWRGATVAHPAAETGTLSLLQRLHEAFPDAIYDPDQGGNTAMHVAARKWKGDMVQWLVEQTGIEGALEKNTQELTPLYLLSFAPQEANKTIFMKLLNEALDASKSSGKIMAALKSDARALAFSAWHSSNPDALKAICKADLLDADDLPLSPPDADRPILRNGDALTKILECDTFDSNLVLERAIRYGSLPAVNAALSVVKLPRARHLRTSLMLFAHPTLYGRSAPDGAHDIALAITKAIADEAFEVDDQPEGCLSDAMFYAAYNEDSFNAAKSLHADAIDAPSLIFSFAFWCTSSIVEPAKRFLKSSIRPKLIDIDFWSPETVGGVIATALLPQWRKYGAVCGYESSQGRKEDAATRGIDAIGTLSMLFDVFGKDWLKSGIFDSVNPADFVAKGFTCMDTLAGRLRMNYRTLPHPTILIGAFADDERTPAVATKIADLINVDEPNSRRAQLWVRNLKHENANFNAVIRLASRFGTLGSSHVSIMQHLLPERPKLAMRMAGTKLRETSTMLATFGDLDLAKKFFELLKDGTLDGDIFYDEEEIDDVVGAVLETPELVKLVLSYDVSKSFQPSSKVLSQLAVLNRTASLPELRWTPTTNVQYHGAMLGGVKLEPGRNCALFKRFHPLRWDSSFHFALLMFFSGCFDTIDKTETWPELDTLDSETTFAQLFAKAKASLSPLQEQGKQWHRRQEEALIKMLNKWGIVGSPADLLETCHARSLHRAASWIVNKSDIDFLASLPPPTQRSIVQMGEEAAASKMIAASMDPVECAVWASRRPDGAANIFAEAWKRLSSADVKKEAARKIVMAQRATATKEIADAIADFRPISPTAQDFTAGELLAAGDFAGALSHADSSTLMDGLSVSSVSPMPNHCDSKGPELLLKILSGNVGASRPLQRACVQYFAVVGYRFNVFPERFPVELQRLLALNENKDLLFTFLKQAEFVSKTYKQVPWICDASTMEFRKQNWSGLGPCVVFTDDTSTDAAIDVFLREIAFSRYGDVAYPAVIAEAATRGLMPMECEATEYSDGKPLVNMPLSYMLTCCADQAALRKFVRLLRPPVALTVGEGGVSPLAAAMLLDYRKRLQLNPTQIAELLQNCLGYTQTLRFQVPEFTKLITAVVEEDALQGQSIPASGTALIQWDDEGESPPITSTRQMLTVAVVWAVRTAFREQPTADSIGRHAYASIDYEMPMGWGENYEQHMTEPVEFENLNVFKEIVFVSASERQRRERMERAKRERNMPPHKRRRHKVGRFVKDEYIRRQPLPQLWELNVHSLTESLEHISVADLTDFLVSFGCPEKALENFRVIPLAFREGKYPTEPIQVNLTLEGGASGVVSCDWAADAAAVNVILGTDASGLGAADSVNEWNAVSLRQSLAQRILSEFTESTEVLASHASDEIEHRTAFKSESDRTDYTQRVQRKEEAIRMGFFATTLAPGWEDYLNQTYPAFRAAEQFGVLVNHTLSSPICRAVQEIRHMYSVNSDMNISLKLMDDPEKAKTIVAEEYVDPLNIVVPVSLGYGMLVPAQEFSKRFGQLSGKSVFISDSVHGDFLPFARLAVDSWVTIEVDDDVSPAKLVDILQGGDIPYRVECLHDNAVRLLRRYGNVLEVYYRTVVQKNAGPPITVPHRSGSDRYRWKPHENENEEDDGKPKPVTVHFVSTGESHVQFFKTGGVDRVVVYLALEDNFEGIWRSQLMNASTGALLRYKFNKIEMHHSIMPERQPASKAKSKNFVFCKHSVTYPAKVPQSVTYEAAASMGSLLGEYLESWCLSVYGDGPKALKYNTPFHIHVSFASQAEDDASMPLDELHSTLEKLITEGDAARGTMPNGADDEDFKELPVVKRLVVPILLNQTGTWFQQKAAQVEWFNKHLGAQ